MGIYVAFILLLFVAAVLVRFFRPIIELVVALRNFWRLKRNKPARIMPHTVKAVQSLQASKAHWLDKHNIFYRHLSKQDKAEFLYRVQKFISMKEWDFREDSLKGQEEEIKTVVASAAIQIVFNLPVATFLPRYETFYIYHDDFYSPSGEGYHKGEVNTRGKLVVLSWKHIEQGFANTQDALNLALHELTHVLSFENQRRKSSDYANMLFSPGAYERYSKLEMRELGNIRKGTNTFLREYGGANLEEFFAVAMEAFFEQPHEFYSNIPDLYEAMAEMLNQDPRNYMPKPEA